MASFINVRIVNWDKYNPRKDLKSLTWIRLDGDIGFSESLFGLSIEAKWLWIFLLSYSSKKNSGEFSIDESYLSHHSGISMSSIELVLSSLSDKKLISIDSNDSLIRTDSIVDDHDPTENVSYERTNITNTTNDTHSLTVSKIPTIDPEKVRDLFDLKLGGRGRVRRVPGHNFPSGLRQDFINITGNAEFNRIEKWEEYFDIVSKSDWLMNRFNTSLSWLLKPDNAFKVFEGVYDDKPEQKNPNGTDLDAVVDKLFQEVVNSSIGLTAVQWQEKFTENEKIIIAEAGGSRKISEATDDYVKNKIKKSMKETMKRLA